MLPGHWRGVTPKYPRTTHAEVKAIQGAISRAHARPFNYYILLFPQAFSHVHESAMLPKSDIFLLLWNEWQGMGKRDKDESMIENGDRAKHTRNEDIASGGN